MKNDIHQFSFNIRLINSCIQKKNNYLQDKAVQLPRKMCLLLLLAIQAVKKMEIEITLNGSIKQFLALAPVKYNIITNELNITTNKRYY